MSSLLPSTSSVSLHGSLCSTVFFLLPSSFPPAVAIHVHTTIRFVAYSTIAVGESPYPRLHRLCCQRLSCHVLLEEGGLVCAIAGEVRALVVDLVKIPGKHGCRAHGVAHGAVHLDGWYRATPSTTMAWDRFRPRHHHRPLTQGRRRDHCRHRWRMDVVSPWTSAFQVALASASSLLF